ncbi:hypothetical protein HHK36_000454 [Tetracentron sinense]|uniref:Uncharacterized protein n=1 Tax=Tetracentron sinense TaxID=13715 RepID=A0A835DTU3_TETSI|nr:hypothetical protein HHK36_000454 [Tetracentron sinense]
MKFEACVCLVSVDLPPWFSLISMALVSDVDLDKESIEKLPRSTLPIICFRDGSPLLPNVSNTSIKVLDSLTNGFVGSIHDLQNVQKCHPSQRNTTVTLKIEQVAEENGEEEEQNEYIEVNADSTDSTILLNLGGGHVSCLMIFTFSVSICLMFFILYRDGKIQGLWEIGKDSAKGWVCVDSDDSCKIVLKKDEGFNHLDRGSNIGLFVGEWRPALPHHGCTKYSLDRSGFVSDTYGSGCKWNNLGNSGRSLSPGIFLRDLHAPHFEERGRNTAEISAGLIVAQAVSSLKIAEDAHAQTRLSSMEC